MIKAIAVTLAVAALLSGAPAHAQEARWSPGHTEPWAWVLDHPLNVNNATDMKGGDDTQPTVYDIDGFENPATTVSALHARGYRVICYVSVGSAENFRPDYAQFPAAVKGRNVSGWAGEKWLDIRRLDILAPIMTARFQMCKDKGFDAVEPDLMDGYTNRTGFPLTGADQLTYNRWIADTVHSLGLSVLLKGDPEQAAQLEPSFDFALNEECAAYNECGSYAAFFNANKTVLHAEYTALSNAKMCYPGMNTTRFKYDLAGWRRTPCY